MSEIIVENFVFRVIFFYVIEINFTTEENDRFRLSILNLSIPIRSLARRTRKLILSPTKSASIDLGLGNVTCVFTYSNVHTFPRYVNLVSPDVSGYLQLTSFGISPESSADPRRVLFPRYPSIVIANIRLIYDFDTIPRN